MKTLENYMAVQDGSEGIIGKIVYYSIAGILVDKQVCQDVGRSLGLPKIKPSRESRASAYKYATTALKDRVSAPTANGTKIHRIYCRDNRKDDPRRLCRELVKETLNAQSNEYKKLANIVFDKEAEEISCENLEPDDDVDAAQYCDHALTLYDKFRNCYNADHIDAMLQDMLDRMQANHISIRGNLYFVPASNLRWLDILEDYIAALAQHNQSGSAVVCNSMFVADDQKQRDKMAQEFYTGYRRDIEAYQERIQHFIDGGCTSKAVIDRWLLKIKALEDKKKTYETILQRQLDAMDQDFALLQMQADELRIRDVQGQMKLAA